MFEKFDKPFEWDGYYNRPFGRESCYHVNTDCEIRIAKNENFDRFLFRAC